MDFFDLFVEILDFCWNALFDLMDLWDWMLIA
jgi:hypothetical protein